MNSSPIFVHSLFRSGSTYFFNVFRRSPAGFYCFQEALHPVVFFNRDKPQELLKFHTSTHESLRHPNLDKPYFYELASLPPAWAEKITYSALFDGYFGSNEADNGVEFFRTLLDQVKDKRVVFEECRTAGRIGLLKENLGGFHIYLWRNPWDQWWSYKTTNGFDHQNRQIINAPNNLNSIFHLRSQLSFQEAYTGPSPQMNDGVFTAEESYLTYYLIWCLGLHEGVKHAHVLINIDRLTESETYREEILSRLSENGIEGIDFSDCRIPQGSYFEEDVNFFSPLEERVYEWLKDDLSVEGLNRIQELRKQYQPQIPTLEKSDEQTKNLARQITQIRSISRRIESEKASHLKKYLTANRELLIKLEQEAAIYNSHSWRFTQPLRWLGNQIRLLRSHGFKKRFAAFVKKYNDNK